MPDDTERKFKIPTQLDQTVLHPPCLSSNDINPETCLANISSDLLQILEPFFEEKMFEKGEHLIRQGDVGDCLFVVVSGRVSIYSEDPSGKTNYIDESGPGDVLGEMALLTGESRSANAVASEEVKALALAAQTVHTLSKRHPNLAVLMTDVVAKRLGAVEFDALAGKQLGGFQLTRRLGRGGMAVVYEAIDPRSNDRVALKMMSHRLVYDDRALSQFEQEFEIVRSFESPYIVKTVSKFEAFHTYFLVLEFCDGRPLNELIHESPLAAPLAEQVFNCAAAAVDYAHQRGVIHRDIKPANIICDENGGAKLMDFGLARPIHEIDPCAGISGTVHYLAPELIISQPASKKSDYFALGLMALEMVTGEKVLQGETTRDIFHQLNNWSQPDVRKLCPELSDQFCDQIASLLAPEPYRRVLNSHLQNSD